MTEKEIRAYIAALQPILKLADWEIRVEIGNCHPDSWAQTFTSARYKKATVRVSAEIVAGNCEENVRAILIHELMHCYTASGQKSMDSLIDPERSERDRLLGEIMNDTIESLIDPMSEVIEGLLEVEA